MVLSVYYDYHAPYKVVFHQVVSHSKPAWSLWKFVFPVLALLCNDCTICKLSDVNSCLCSWNVFIPGFSSCRNTWSSFNISFSFLCTFAFRLLGLQGIRGWSKKHRRCLGGDSDVAFPWWDNRNPGWFWVRGGLWYHSLSFYRFRWSRLVNVFNV